MPRTSGVFTYLCFYSFERLSKYLWLKKAEHWQACSAFLWLFCPPCLCYEQVLLMCEWSSIVAVICVTTVLKYRMSCLFLQLIFVSMHLYLFITRENIWVIVYFQCSSSCFLFQNLKDSLIAYIFPFEILCCLPVVPILLNMTKAPVKSYFIYWML